MFTLTLLAVTLAVWLLTVVIGSITILFGPVPEHNRFDDEDNTGEKEYE